jgi:hypothetical protein
VASGALRNVNFLDVERVISVWKHLVLKGFVVKAEVWGLINREGLFKEQMWLSTCPANRSRIPINGEAAERIRSQRLAALCRTVTVLIAHAGFRYLGINYPMIPSIDLQCSHIGEGWYPHIPGWVKGMKLEPGVFESVLTNSSRKQCAAGDYMWRNENHRLIELHELATYRGRIKCPHNPPCRAPYPGPGAPVRRNPIETKCDNVLGRVCVRTNKV